MDENGQCTPDDAAGRDAEGDRSRRVEAVRRAVEEYPGYERPEDRRVSDESVRAALAASLAELLLHVESLEDHLSRNGQEELAQRAAQAGRHAELIRDKIEMPPYSVSPFFAARRLPEETQDRILSNDADLVEDANELRRVLSLTLSDRTDLAAFVGDLQRIIDSLTAQIDSRCSLIAEFHL